MSIQLFTKVYHFRVRGLLFDKMTIWEWQRLDLNKHIINQPFFLFSLFLILTLTLAYLLPFNKAFRCGLLLNNFFKSGKLHVSEW